MPKPPAATIMRKLGLNPDPWQIDVLEGDHQRLLLNCSRQAGKSTAVAMLALVEALHYPGMLVLLLSRSFRQSQNLFRIIADFYQRLGCPFQKHRTKRELELTYSSRIISLPCNEETIRGYSRVNLLIIDEAARVPDDLYRSVRPMLAVSNGRLICLSTPYGKRGFFWKAWTSQDPIWKRIEIPASQIPRIKPDFIAEETRAMGESWVRQEYFCSFEALEGLVYPDFAKCLSAPPPFLSALLSTQHSALSTSSPHSALSTLPGRLVGGLDFGFRNPFAAVWGLVDRDDVLWLFGEHYQRQKPLSHHAQFIPKNVRWFADPSGANEISELRHASFKVVPGDNDIRLGIAAVTARLETGTLKVVEGTCPNLLAEAQLYRHSPEASARHSETPLDKHNHALGALRYLISKLDTHRMARLRKGPASTAESSSHSLPPDPCPPNPCSPSLAPL